MSISGEKAVRLLERHIADIRLFQRDKTNKFWSYKLVKEPRREIAFDPTTTQKLIVRFDVMPPALPGVLAIEKLKGRGISTALGRVFSGGLHVARYKATIVDEETFLAVIKELGKS